MRISKAYPFIQVHNNGHATYTHNNQDVPYLIQEKGILFRFKDPRTKKQVRLRAKDLMEEVYPDLIFGPEYGITFFKDNNPYNTQITNLERREVTKELNEATIRDLYFAGSPMRFLADFYGLHLAQVQRIVKGKTKRKGYKWLELQQYEKTKQLKEQYRKYGHINNDLSLGYYAKIVKTEEIKQLIEKENEINAKKFI